LFKCEEYFDNYFCCFGEKKKNNNNDDDYIKDLENDPIFANHSNLLCNYFRKSNSNEICEIPFMKIIKISIHPFSDYFFFIPPNNELLLNNDLNFTHKCIDCDNNMTKKTDNIDDDNDIINFVENEEKKTSALVISSCISSILLMIIKFSHKSHMFQFECITEYLSHFNFLYLIQKYLNIFSDILNYNLKKDDYCYNCKSLEFFSDYYFGYPYSIFIKKPESNNNEISKNENEMKSNFKEINDDNSNSWEWECVLEEDEKNLKNNMKTWWRNSYFNPKNENYPFENIEDKRCDSFFLKECQNKNKYIFCFKNQMYIPHKEYFDELKQIKYYHNPLSIGIIGHFPISISKHEEESYKKENLYPSSNKEKSYKKKNLYPSSNEEKSYEKENLYPSSTSSNDITDDENFKNKLLDNFKCTNDSKSNNIDNTNTKEKFIENDFILTILNLIRIFLKMIKTNPQLVSSFIFFLSFFLIILLLF
jgi:hypothetical protein